MDSKEVPQENVSEVKSTLGTTQQTIIIQQPTSQSNALGLTGFIIALLGVIFCWIPILNFVLWIIGLILSLIGVFKKPRGFAIAGLCISFIDVIIFIVLLGSLLAIFAAH